jgi:outer membrane lipoprotein-sorting protein
MKVLKLTVLAFLVVLTATAWADKALDYVHRVDKNMQPGKDMTAISTTKIISAGGSTETRVMKMYRKGGKKMFFFLSPAGVKGVAFLSLSDDQMYLYMPAFKKVRRIASSARGGSFMGTDMAYEDMATTDYTRKYNVKLVSEDDKEAHLIMTAKPGSDAAYSKMEATVDKVHWLRKFSKVYDKAGKLLKLMSMENVKIIDGFAVPTHIVIKNVQTNHQTIIDNTDIKFNTGLRDSLFSKRKLSHIK